MDYGDRYTEKKISAVNRELRKTFRTAQKELKKKLADFEKRHAKENQRKKDQLAAGKITKQDYQDWLTGQVFIRNQWQANLRQVCKTMHDANQQTMNIINNSRFDVFAENYNFNAWQAEKAINVSFNLYNAESVARLMTDDPQLLPEWKINEEKDYIWNYNRVNNIVRQGIIQGEGIPEITDRLCSGLATSNESKMRMFARTALGAAQSAGRQKQMEDAAAMGIEVNKRWMAAHDSKTRDAHRDLDGQEVPYDKPFKSELGEIEYPKDPKAHPANVFNCRCTMVTIYPKYEDRSVQYGEGVTIDGQSYEEWKKGKKARGEVQSASNILFSEDAAKQPNQLIPSIGKVIGLEKPTSADYDHEHRIAEKIVEVFGGDVEMLDQRGNNTVADYKWNNSLWELKTPRTENAVDGRTHDITKKMKTIDCNAMIDVLCDDIENSVKKIQNRIVRSAPRSCQVVVFHKGEFYATWTYNKRDR